MAVIGSTRSIPEKLQIKPGKTVLFVNKPSGYDKLLGKMPSGVMVADESGKFVDIVQVFVESRQQLELELPRLKKMIQTNGMIWITYPKGTSGKDADINRDSISAYAETIGLEGVALVSIDSTWAALRVKIVVAS
jgi:hypothetical protein